MVYVMCVYLQENPVCNMTKIFTLQELEGNGLFLPAGRSGKDQGIISLDPASSGQCVYSFWGGHC